MSFGRVLITTLVWLDLSPTFILDVLAGATKTSFRSAFLCLSCDKCEAEASCAVQRLSAKLELRHEDDAVPYKMNAAV